MKEAHYYGIIQYLYAPSWFHSISQKNLVLVFKEYKTGVKYQISNQVVSATNISCLNNFIPCHPLAYNATAIRAPVYKDHHNKYTKWFIKAGDS